MKKNVKKYILCIYNILIYTKLNNKFKNYNKGQGTNKLFELL